MLLGKLILLGVTALPLMHKRLLLMPLVALPACAPAPTPALRTLSSMPVSESAVSSLPPDQTELPPGQPSQSPLARALSHGTQEFSGNGHQCELTIGPPGINHHEVTSSVEMEAILTRLHRDHIESASERIWISYESDNPHAVTTEGGFVWFRHLRLQGHPTHLYTRLGAFLLGRRCDTGAGVPRVVQEDGQPTRIELNLSHVEFVTVCLDENGKEFPFWEAGDDDECLPRCLTQSLETRVWVLDEQHRPQSLIRVIEFGSFDVADPPVPRISFDSDTPRVTACGKTVDILPAET